MAMMLQRVMQRAVTYLQEKVFFAPMTSFITPLVVAGAAPAADALSESIWLAAPKSKVTPSRKKIRNNDPSKRLKNIVHFQDCPMCGDKKLRHRLCMSCFKKGKYFV